MAINMNNVGNRTNLHVEQKQKQQEAVAKGAEQAPAKAATAKDSVSLTPQAQALKGMQKQVSAEGTFNKERVETLKKAILNGEYAIDADKLAQKMSAFEGEFGKAI